jgi:hypothetical protein
MLYRGTLATVGCLAMALSVPARAAAAPADTGMGFSVDVSLSGAAAAKLSALKEAITIAAYWYGEPTRAARKQADEMGQINLGTEDVRIPGSGGRGEITGRKVQVKRIAWVRDRAVQVNINVFSARLSGPNNYLDCGLFEDAVTVARAKPIQIACKLIGER